MSFFTKLNLARIDKKIATKLRNSNWYKNNRDKELSELSIQSIDRNEEWIKEVEYFIDVALSKNQYKRLFEEFGLHRNDLIHFYLLMTISTMPNPVFRTGPSIKSTTLVGSSLYQEIDRQFKPLLNSLGTTDTTKKEQELFGHEYAADVMMFAYRLKNMHDVRFGEALL